MSENSSPVDGSRTEIIFYAALERPSPEERSRYLAEACGDDENLRASVTRLLHAHAEAGETFLKHENLATALSEADAQFAFLRMERAGDGIGDYKLMEQLGEGGFGVVWMAEQEKPVRRRVALKILKPGMDTREVIARFQAERQALALMDHPNIARVFDAGSTSSGRPYFVMELVRGKKITEYCDTANLSPRARLELFIQVCQAVQHAHQKGIIHRDLKPSNILVTEQDGVPIPKVIDFGIAKATEQRLTDLSVVTRLEQMIGTPLYMSPEQAEQRVLDIDTRSDIYSLGVLLYELLTGRTPFSADELMRRGIEEIRRVIREEEPARPSTALVTMNKDALGTIAKSRCMEPPKLITVLKGDLDWIVMRAIEKDRGRRYQTANGLAEEIRRHLANEPVLAGPPSRIYRLKKLVRRNRLAFASGVAIAFTILATLATSTYLLIREYEARMYASKTLTELQATAPAFLDQAHSLVEQGDFEGAIEKLEYAAKLRPDVSEYAAAKGDLLQSVLRLPEAVTAYQSALALDPADKRAQSNEALCRRILASTPDVRKLTRESLSALYMHMQQEQRPSAQLIPVAQLLGKERQLLLGVWMEKLKPLPIPAEKPLEQRLTMRSDGLLALDLSGTRVTNLHLLKGMPLGELNCSGCRDLIDISPLRGLPLMELYLEDTNVYDVTPVKGIRTLKALTLSRSKVIQLEPLKGLTLESIHLDELHLPDISALKGMPLKELSIRKTPAADLSALSGMPLLRLNMDDVPARDFSPLSGLPLERIEMRGTNPLNLDFLPTTAVKELFISRFQSRALSRLQEVHTLETLALPDDYRLWNDTDQAAFLALRNHSGLRYLGVERESGGQSGALPPAKDFWKQWDYEAQVLKPLRDQGIRVELYIEPDRTWAVSLANEPVKDLSPLRSAPITRLNLQYTKVEDISPLAELRLRALSLARVNVKDIRPLKGMPLEELDLERTPVTDLTPLKGMPLRRLNIEQTAISDIVPLRGMALQELWMGTTHVSDLSPLKGMPLRLLHIDDCPRLTDVSPLIEVPALEQLLVPKAAQNLNVLRALPKLRYIAFENYASLNIPTHTSEEFWSMDSPATMEELAKQRRYIELERLLRIRIANRNSTTQVPDHTRLAIILLDQDEHEKYRSICAEMHLQFRFAEMSATLKVCSLSPHIGVPAPELEQLLERCISQHRNIREDPSALFACAFAKYRLGHFAETAELLRGFWDERAAPKALALSVLAMAYQRMGDVAAAHTTLAAARKEIHTDTTKHFLDPEYWHETLMSTVVIKEAEQLIGKESAPKN